MNLLARIPIPSCVLWDVTSANRCPKSVCVKFFQPFGIKNFSPVSVEFIPMPFTSEITSDDTPTGISMCAAVI